MGARQLAGIIGVTVLLAAGLSQADSATRVEPLDGMQSLTAPGGIHPEGDARIPAPAVPQGPLSPRTPPPFGGQSPPNQLTPAPVLPFHPNRPLMPSPSAPAPYSGGGHVGR
jgi:hypothetical protein